MAINTSNNKVRIISTTVGLANSNKYTEINSPALVVNTSDGGIFYADGTAKNPFKQLAALPSHTHSGYATTAQLANYLPKTGGQLATTSSTILSLNNTNSINNEVGLRFDMNSSSKGWVGYTSNTGTYLYTYTGPHKLGIKEDGTGFIDGNTIIHSGNIGSQSVASTTNATKSESLAGGHGVSNAANYSITYLAGGFTNNSTATANQVYLGTSSNWDVISSPVHDGTDAVQNIMSLRLGWNKSYWHEIATGPNANNRLYHRSINANTPRSWALLLDSLNYTDYCASVGHTHDYLPLSGGTINGDISIPIARATLHNSIPVSGGLDRYGKNYYDAVPELKTFIGTIESSDLGWQHTISVRHRNGYSDGFTEGLVFRHSLVNVNDSIHWSHQRRGIWSDDRVLLDSSNYSGYALPITGGTMTGSTQVNSSAFPAFILNHTGSQQESGIRFEMNGVYKGYVGYHDSYGTYIWNTTATKYLCIADDGEAYVRSTSVANKVIHSGNIGQQTVASATTATTATTSLTSNKLKCTDSRDTSILPNETTIGIVADFKAKAITGLTSTYSGVITFRSYGSGGDLSGGPVYQIAMDLAGIHSRTSKDTSTWNTWVNILDSANYTDYCAAKSHSHSYLPLAGGTVTGTITATNFITSSDKRLKTNIKSLHTDSKSLELNFYEFDYVNNNNHSAGHIAQEVKEVLPEFVHGNESETEHLSIDYTGLHSVQIKALLDRIIKLEEEIKILKSSK